MVANAITIVPVVGPDALYCRYERQPVQPVHLDLDLKTGELTCGYNPEVNGIPEPVYHGRRLWVGVPCLTADAANELLSRVEPFAAIVLAGSDIEWDGRNHVGNLSDEAVDAWGKIAAMCEADDFDDGDLVVGYDAEEWYTDAPGGIAANPERLGITADSTDEELAALAATAEQEAATSGTYGHIVLEGALEWMTERRADLRAELR